MSEEGAAVLTISVFGLVLPFTLTKCLYPLVLRLVMHRINGRFLCQIPGSSIWEEAIENRIKLSLWTNWDFASPRRLKMMPYQIGSSPNMGIEIALVGHMIGLLYRYTVVSSCDFTYTNSGRII